MTPAPSDFLPLAREAASAAAAVLLAERPLVIAEGASATKSSDTDPVTRADVAAQQVIADMIVRARPGDGIFGEERASTGTGDSGWRWFVDPLDGTVNYLYGRDQWSVSIARPGPGRHDGRRRRPRARARPDLHGLRGSGCWLDGQRLAVRPGTDLAHAVIGTGFSYDAGTRAAQAAVLSRLLPAVADIRRCGSAALDLADVASGRIDAFYENDLSPWDWAAGALLAAEAGASVSELPGPGGRSGILAATPALAGPLSECLLSRARPARS